MKHNPFDFKKSSEKNKGPKKSKSITTSPKSTKKKKKNSILEVNDLVAGYGKSTILHGIHFNLYEKELVAVIGPNGAGKSTLSAYHSAYRPGRRNLW